METFLLYLVKVAAANAIMVAVYMAFLRKGRPFVFTRFYLLGAAILPWIIPLVTLTFTRTLETLPSAEMTSMPALMPATSPAVMPGRATGLVEAMQLYTPKAQSGLLIHILFLAYLAGSLFFLLRLLLSFAKLSMIMRRCIKTMIGTDRIRVSEEAQLPFSFFNMKVIGSNMLTHPQLDLMLRHEGVHERQGHSYDIIVAETGKALLWFNPFAWMLEEFVKTNLEYLADAETAQTENERSKYQYLLISLAQGGTPVRIVSGLYQTQIKKRIIMLKTNHHKKRLDRKCLIAFPVLAALLLSFCHKEIRYVIQDELVVTGQVTTVQGHIPIPGVYVGIKGEVAGTATDAEGNYSIRLNSPADTLEIVYNGTQLIMPKGRSRIDVTFEDSNRLLANIFRILGPDANPVVIANDERVEKGLMGIDPRGIQTLQVLEGDKAVQALGSEEGRKGLVIIQGRSTSYFRDYEIIFLDGKRFDGPMEAIHPEFRIMVSGFPSTAFLLPGEESEKPVQFRMISTRKPRGRNIDSDILQLVTGRKTMDLAEEPITVINGKRYVKGLRNIDPDDIIYAESITGEDAYLVSGLEEARKRGIAFIGTKVPYE